MPLEEIKKHIEEEKNPLISIIMPLYNAAAYISDTIRSVKNQTYTNWELIIVDDHSSDTSAKLVLEFAATDSRIKLQRLSKNKGAAFCRNYATQMSGGDYIAFLDADDLWFPEKLSRQLLFMLAAKCDVSYTSYLHIDEEGNSMKKRICAIEELPYEKQHWNNYIGNLTGMYHVKSIGKILAPDIRKRQDWAVWLEAIRRSGKPALGLQQDLAYYRVREGSISSKKWHLVKYNYLFYREYLGYSALKSVYCLFRFFFEYFFVRPKYIQRLKA